MKSAVLVLLGLLLFIDIPSSDCIECTISQLQEITSNCTVINGDVAIYEVKNFSFAQLSEMLANVKKVNGRVFLVDTIFQNFSFFSSLESIWYMPDRDFKNQYNLIALRIENNPFVEELGMPNLMSIHYESLPTDVEFFATSISGNPKLCLPFEQTESWMRNESRIKLPQFSYCGMTVIEDEKYYKKYTVPNSTKIFCSMEWFNGSMPRDCQILDSGIWIRNNLNETELEYFSVAIQSAERIMGPIVVKNSTIKYLNFRNLKTIYNMYFHVPESAGGWGYQVMQFINNDLLVEVQFPVLDNIYHSGKEAYMKAGGNSLLKCNEKTCSVFLSLWRFDLNSCSCGHIPVFNQPYTTWYLFLNVTEAIICILLTFRVYGKIMYHVYKAGFSVSYFQFSMIVYLVLSCLEALYIVLNYIQFMDGRGYQWYIGAQFLLFTNKESYFFQSVNIIYTNRISLLLSCCLYRTISFVSFDLGKLALVMSFGIFVVSNIWSFKNLLESGSKWMYGVYIINWTTFVVSIVTGIFLYFYLAKNFVYYRELVKHQNNLSKAFFAQALLSLIFCGFPDSIFEAWSAELVNMEIVRTRRVAAYYTGTYVIRWHYLAYAYVLKTYLHDMISKVNIQRSETVTVAITSSFRSMAAPIARVH